MFRFSERYHRHQADARRSQEAIEGARLAMERERRVSQRWRMRNPDRNPEKLLKTWKDNKAKTAVEYSKLIIQFISTFDGVHEANQMMRHGLEAGDAEIPLPFFEELAQSTFNLRLFELFADQCGLSRYTRELVIQRLVPQYFSGPQGPSRTKPFDMAITSLEGTDPQSRRGRNER